MAKRLPNAKRASRANPRIDRNIQKHVDNILDFGGFEPNAPKGSKNRRDQRRHENDSNVTYLKTKDLEIVPRNLAQESYLDALNDPNNAIIFAMGPAGTGKTMLAVKFAIKEYMSGRCKKIIITRPTVSTGEDIGFLPGDATAKLLPWSLPVIDIFHEVFSAATVNKMIESGQLEIAPLAFMRGRTLKNSIVIAEEFQNSLVSQQKMLLTRIGDNSRIIVTGDLEQNDRGFDNNGLKDFVSRFKSKGGKGIIVCEFFASDVERHAVIEEILRLYRD